MAYNPQLFYDIKDLDLAAKYNLIDLLEKELEAALVEADDYNLILFIDFINSIPS